MANRKKEVYKPKPMTEEREILFKDYSRSMISICGGYSGCIKRSSFRNNSRYA